MFARLQMENEMARIGNCLARAWRKIAGWDFRPALVAATCVLTVGSLLTFYWEAQAADRDEILRGKYLVTQGLCTDCHTPGYFFGKPDAARFLGGSEVGFEIPGLGVFHGPNLTPDNETGLGTWSKQDIVTVLRTGVRPDGRELAPIMPWRAFAELTEGDREAIAAYLKSVPAVSNKVPGPFGPTETPTSFVFKVVPPAAPSN
jgi:mono/diheme cytochrome c family protein